MAIDNILATWLLLLTGLCCAHDIPTVKTELNETLRETLANATSIEVFRLTGDAERDRDEKNWKRGPTWNTERTREIAAKFLSDDTYLFSMKNRCIPRPGVLLRLKSEKNSVDASFCFECSILQFLDGKTSGILFDPSRSYWTRLAKEAFPDDAAIQSLKGKDMPLEEKKRLDNELLRLAKELEAKRAQKDKDGEKK